MSIGFRHILVAASIAAVLVAVPSLLFFQAQAASSPPATAALRGDGTATTMPKVQSNGIGPSAIGQTQPASSSPGTYAVATPPPGGDVTTMPKVQGSNGVTPAAIP
jgi:hypothetical protein